MKRLKLGFHFLDQLHDLFDGKGRESNAAMKGMHKRDFRAASNGH
jgi:hypothetical protein